MAEEAQALLLAVDRALASGGNSQSIGRSGEIPLRDFLNRYLPYTLRAETGHFVTPQGNLSPQIDIMILDARYPLLSRNADGSILAMLHAVITTIEVKSNISTKDLSKVWKDSEYIEAIAREAYPSFGWQSVACCAFAYRSRNRLRTLSQRFFETGAKSKGYLDLYLMILPEKDQGSSMGAGAYLHFEAGPHPEHANTEVLTPMLVPMHTVLSDFYYRIIQDSYYTLSSRGQDFNSIGQQIMDYLSLSVDYTLFDSDS